MSIHFTVFIAIDDDTPADKDPFSHDPSIWSLESDYGLSRCGDRQLFAALGFDPTKQYPAPLVQLRGFPSFVPAAYGLHNRYDSSDHLGWLSASEFNDAIEYSGLNRENFRRPVMALISCINSLMFIYGGQNVRIIFCFEL